MATDATTHPTTAKAATPVAAWLSGFGPPRAGYHRADYARGAIGAFAGILLACLVGAVAAGMLAGSPEALPYIVAPIGASAVLVMAVPASPLAQPWSVLGGNVLSATVGIASAKVFDNDAVAAAVAVGAAIAAMMAARCVHPPGGACALFAAVGGPAIQDHGFAFALWPVGVNTVALILVGIAVNNLTGRSYPHVPDAAAAAAEPGPLARAGVQAVDVDKALARLDSGLDVMPADVVALVMEAERHALDRRLGGLRCGDIMATDVATVEPTETLFRARLLINQRRFKAVPVVTPDRRVVGIVTVFDLFNLDVADLAPVASVMTSPATTVRDDSPVSDLLSLMTDRGFHHIPVLDGDDRLVGIVTRSELIAVLHRALLESAPGDGPPGG